MWDRLGGADRYATAAAVSRSSFPTGGAGAVVLARGDAYPDALVGVPLAAARHAPLLLTHGTTLPTVTLTEIRRVLPAGGTVYLLGGTDVVPASIGTQLATLGYQTTRYAGVDRFATAVAVADALGDPSTVLLASGLNFPDALAAGPAATAVHGVVLLTAGATLPPVTAAYLTAHPGTVYAIGGPAAAADPTAQPLVGADRYATAATVAATFFPAPTTVGIATGLNFPDALAGAAQLATAGGPLLLTTTSVLPAATGSALTAVKASLDHHPLLRPDRRRRRPRRPRRSSQPRLLTHPATTPASRAPRPQPTQDTHPPATPGLDTGRPSNRRPDVPFQCGVIQQSVRPAPSSLLDAGVAHRLSRPCSDPDRRRMLGQWRRRGSRVPGDPKSA